MSEGSESEVTVPQASGGPNIRNIQFYYWNAVANAFVPVQQQVTILADKDGFVADVNQLEMLMLARAQLCELRDIRRALSTMSGTTLWGSDPMGLPDKF